MTIVKGKNYKIFNSSCFDAKYLNCDFLLSDPPYGCKNNCDYTRFTGGLTKSKNYKAGIPADDKEFDPRPFLNYKKVALFGYQFFSNYLSVGTILVWNKKRPEKLGKFLSDCELCWLNIGKGCYLFNYFWSGFDRQGERGKSLHPSQKPVALIKWIIEKAKIPPKSLICDPFMGSGSIGVAALEMGHYFIGYEIVKEYFDIADKRLENVGNP